MQHDANPAVFMKNIAAKSNVFPFTCSPSMHRFFYCLTVALLPIMGQAQSTQSPCDCASVLEEAIQKVTTVYAGYDDKLTPATRSRYNQLLYQVRQRAPKADDERACYEVLRHYTNFFRDSHISVWFSTHSSPTRLRRVKLETLPRTLATQATGIEGIWVTADHKQQFAICPDPSALNQFIAVTLASPDSAWVPGMVKAEIYRYNQHAKRYQGLFYQANFTGLLDGFKLSENRIDHLFGPAWYRQGKEDQTPKPQPTVEFKILDPQFIYLRLARFDQGDVRQLDSLLKANREVIAKTRNVLVDLRGNGGGNASSSDEMIRLIYTNPIIYPAWQYRSCPELIKATQNTIARLQTHSGNNDLILKRQVALLGALQAHPGQLVSGGEDLTRKADSTAVLPQRIAFLLDGNCGSSTEFFVFEGKQSKKVTTFGSNTHGVMDYGQAQSFPLACGQYVLGIPWGRNGWIERFGYRTDNIGFAPDVAIASSEPDWVQFIQRYWAR